MAHDREVAGLWCREVLEHLPDYIEGEISDPLRERVEGHLRGCSWCEEFGGAYASTVGTIRTLLQDEGDGVPEEVAARLKERLRPGDG